MQTNPAFGQNKNVKWSHDSWNHSGRWGKGLWWEAFDGEYHRIYPFRCSNSAAIFLQKSIGNRQCFAQISAKFHSHIYILYEAKIAQLFIQLMQANSLKNHQQLTRNENKQFIYSKQYRLSHSMFKVSGTRWRHQLSFIRPTCSQSPQEARHALTS